MLPALPSQLLSLLDPLPGPVPPEIIHPPPRSLPAEPQLCSISSTAPSAVGPSPQWLEEVLMNHIS